MIANITPDHYIISSKDEQTKLVFPIIRSQGVIDMEAKDRQLIRQVADNVRNEFSTEINSLESQLRSLENTVKQLNQVQSQLAHQQSSPQTAVQGLAGQLLQQIQQFTSQAQQQQFQSETQIQQTIQQAIQALNQASQYIGVGSIVMQMNQLVHQAQQRIQQLVHASGQPQMVQMTGPQPFGSIAQNVQPPLTTQVNGQQMSGQTSPNMKQSSFFIQ
jgi:DNA repair exonuclease SbcCD ATPase subunit